MGGHVGGFLTSSWRVVRMTRHVLAAKASAGRDEKGREVVVSQLGVGGSQVPRLTCFWK